MALPDRIFAHASPRSVGASLLSEDLRLPTQNSFRAFRSPPAVTRMAAARLEEAGFEILQVTDVTINFAGSPDQFEKSFGSKIVEREVETANGPSVTHLDSPDTDRLGLVSTADSDFAHIIEGVALEVPRRFFQPDPDPPSPGYFHLRPPHDLAAATNSSLAHLFGITGFGVRVAMVDSGWYPHPYFTSRHYQVRPVVLGPGATEPLHDESGHGTGESANILALAPGCELWPVKMNFVNTIGAFNEAVALGPDIITCSWGSHTPYVLSAADIALAASVAAAVASGITVIFSAGNGHAGFPGQHPDVISAGGVYMAEDGSLQASDYSSGFVSQIFPGRIVPDVSGLVGMRPKAIYIMLPVEPGDQIDAGNAGPLFPFGDGTDPDDGWAGFSGTSAAAPQLAGAAALIKQLFPSAGPAEIKAALMASARDVAAGSCSPVQPLHAGLPALPGPDAATGAGLVDAFGAIVAAACGPAAALSAPAGSAGLAYQRGWADGLAMAGVGWA